MGAAALGRGAGIRRWLFLLLIMCGAMMVSLLRTGLSGAAFIQPRPPAAAAAAAAADHQHPTGADGNGTTSVAAGAPATDETLQRVGSGDSSSSKSTGSGGSSGGGKQSSSASGTTTTSASSASSTGINTAASAGSTPAPDSSSNLAPSGTGTGNPVQASKPPSGSKPAQSSQPSGGSPPVPSSQSASSKPSAHARPASGKSAPPADSLPDYVDPWEAAALSAGAKMDGAEMGAAAAAAAAAAAELAAMTLQAQVEAEAEAGPEAGKDPSREGEAAPAATAAASAAGISSSSKGEAQGAAAPPALPSLPVPKVALMFLTRGPLPLSGLWDEWLKGADGGVAPAYSLAALGCDRAAVQRVRQAGAAVGKGPRGQPLPLYHRQRLFSVYVHAPPEYAERYTRGSIFYGRKLKKRVPTGWGTHALVVAVRTLLKEALADPLNQRFVLMSESDMPLWPPALLYLQLMSEPKSRINACAPRNPKEAKHNFPEVAEEVGFPVKDWRKSSQWATLNRAHAQLVVEDSGSEMDALFARECYIKWDTVTWKTTPGQRWCVSDEHYIPSLLASHGREAECSCSLADARTSHMFTAWTGSPHPTEYRADQLTPGRIQDMRGCNNATSELALQRYRELLADPASWTQQACRSVAAQLTGYGVSLPGGRSSSRGVGAAVGGNGSSSSGGTEAGGGGEGGGGTAAAPGAVAGGSSAGNGAAAAAAAGQRALLAPHYQCMLTTRKVAHSGAPALARAIQQGLLESQEAAQGRSA